MTYLQGEWAGGSLRTSTRPRSEHDLPSGLMNRRVFENKHSTEVGAWLTFMLNARADSKTGPSNQHQSSACSQGQPKLASRSVQPPLPILGDFARVESVFGDILLIRLGFSVIWCSGLLLRGILPILFRSTRRPDSPPAPPRIHPKCCSDIEINSGWPNSPPAEVAQSRGRSNPTP